MNSQRAEVVKLVDAVDSKSTEPCARAGSIPAFGTKMLRSIRINLLSSAISVQSCDIGIIWLAKSQKRLDCSSGQANQAIFIYPEYDPYHVEV